MPDYITIEDLRPYDGRYEFELLEKLPTVREWGWLKRHTGTLPPQFLEAVVGGDQEVISACAVITLVRAGKVERDSFDDVYERTLDVEGGSFRIEIGVREEPSVPLPENSSGNEPSSGDGSTTSTERSEPDPRSSGTPASATSELPLTMSVT